MCIKNIHKNLSRIQIFQVKYLTKKTNIQRVVFFIQCYVVNIKKTPILEAFMKPEFMK